MSDPQDTFISHLVEKYVPGKIIRASLGLIITYMGARYILQYLGY